MTTDAPSPERVAVTQEDWDFYNRLVDSDANEPEGRTIECIARFRIATAQASAAEIERLKAEAQGLQYACGEHFNKAARADRRALAAEAEIARLRPALAKLLGVMRDGMSGKGVNPADMLAALGGADAALAAGTSQEVG